MTATESVLPLAELLGRKGGLPSDEQNVLDARERTLGRSDLRNAHAAEAAPGSRLDQTQTQTQTQTRTLNRKELSS
jgi:hypothetical protein